MRALFIVQSYPTRRQQILKLENSAPVLLHTMSWNYFRSSLLQENSLGVQEEKPKLQAIEMKFWLVHNTSIAWNDAQSE